MKGIVRLVEGLFVAFVGQLLLALDYRPQPHQLALARLHRGFANADFLQRFPRDDGLAQFGNGDPGNESAGLRENVDKILFRQPQDRLANRRSADAVFFGQVFFRQRRTGWQRDIYDRVAQVLVDDFRVAGRSSGGPRSCTAWRCIFRSRLARLASGRRRFIQ